MDPSRCCSAAAAAIPVLAVALAADALAQPFFTGIGQFPGSSFSTADGVSRDGGVVVGQAFLGASLVATRWTRATGLTVLPPQTVPSRSVATNADGSVIVGTAGSFASRWTQASGFVRLDEPSSVARAVSADGSTIAGVGRIGSAQAVAFRWTSETGMTTIPPGPGGGIPSFAADISADGSVIVGAASILNSNDIAFRWTESEGAVLLGDLPGGLNASFANGVSAGGAVVVGQSEAAGGTRAFRWTSELGMQPLSNTHSNAFAITADGSLIVGANNRQAALFLDSGEVVNLRTLLTGTYGLDLTGWSLTVATDVSDDGSVIVGQGLHNGVLEGWVAVIPSPGAATVLAMGAGAMLRRRRAHE